MAVALPPSPPSSVQVSRRSKESRSRPNLTKICQKTKMCSFHLQGMCKRAESCSFAHDPNEIQSKPDLACTKLCPSLLSGGFCSKGNLCKFAHSEAELKKLDIEGSATPAIAAVPSDSSALSIATVEIMATCSTASSWQPDSGSVDEGCPVPQTSPQVACCLDDAAMSGALTLGGMIFHLTRVFLAVFEARPEVASRVGVPAEILAAATAEAAWADSGLDEKSLMSFQNLARWCALPSELMPSGVVSPAPSNINVSSPHSDKDELRSDTWSQCSTEDHSDDISFGMPTGWQTPINGEDAEDDWYEPEIKVLNTFIHLSTPSIVTRTRRSVSVPRHFGRMN